MITKKRKASFFTLLELCICIALIGIFSSFLSFKIHGLVEKHTFEKGARRLQNQVSFAKKMALTHQSDMLLKISHDKKGLTYWVGIDDGVSLDTKPFQKGNLEQLKLLVDNEPVECLDITFSSSGGIFLQAADIEVASTKDKKGWKKTISLSL